MKQIILSMLALLVFIGLMACQIENENEKSIFQEEEATPEQPVSMIQASLADNAYQCTEKKLPLFGIMAREVTLLVIGNPQDIPLAGTYVGRREVHEYFAKSHKKIRILGVDVQDILKEGNLINAHLRVRGYVKATGNTFDLEYVYAMETEGRRLRSMVVYYDTFNFRRAMLERGPLSVTDIRNPTRPVSDPQDITDYRPLVAAGLNAFYSGDIPAFLSFIHPEIHWVFKGDTEQVPYAGVYYGFPGMMDFIYRIAPNSYPLGITITGSLQQGNRLDLFIAEQGYAVPTGKIFDIQVLHTFLMKDNKLVEFKTYHDTYAVSQAFTLN